MKKNKTTKNVALQSFFSITIVMISRAEKTQLLEPGRSTGDRVDLDLLSKVE